MPGQQLCCRSYRCPDSYVLIRLCRTVSEQAALWDVHGASKKKQGSLSGE